MKTKLFLFFLLPLMVACGGNNRPKQTESEEVVNVTETEILKGEVIPLDTALFRYAYRIRVAGDRAVMLDLHNPDYYFHVFTYPDFSYLSSFGHRGEGPGEFLGTGNVRFDG
ncbi:MAG: BF3164 family lipoprotein, partial [Bacteroidales bacterium]|nr:BF3164 family lipoprotein [Bacteroidales bacterium]